MACLYSLCILPFLFFLSCRKHSIHGAMSIWWHLCQWQDYQTMPQSVAATHPSQLGLPQGQRFPLPRLLPSLLVLSPPPNRSMLQCHPGHPSPHCEFELLDHPSSSQEHAQDRKEPNSHHSWQASSEGVSNNALLGHHGFAQQTGQNGGGRMAVQSASWKFPHRPLSWLHVSSWHA